MAMKIHNSMSKTKEEFKPMNGNEVKMYACGITVYDDCHIGHAKQAVTFDIIKRYLEYRGYKVTYARNYTDVDDKIIARSNQLGINALEYSQDRINEVERVMALLGVRQPDIEPKASENIENIIDFVAKLIEKGHAYPSERGDVYFSVKSFDKYGKLSKRNPDDMLNGVRIFSSDPVWRQILGDLNAVVLDSPTSTDINFDNLDINSTLSAMELKAVILGAGDNSAILRRIFSHDVNLPRLQTQIVVWLYKTGGMTAAQLKNALGYAPDATTHTVDTAIYQLRKTYGHEFILNNGGVYSIGKL